MPNAAASAARGDWKKTLKLTDRAVKLAPDSTDALVFNAIAALRCGESERAYASASKAVNLSPESFVAQYTLGRACMDFPERQGEALQALLNALRLRGNDRDTLVLLCNIGVETASPQKVLRFLNMLKYEAEFSRSPELYNQMALVYLRRPVDVAKARQAMSNAWNLGRNNLIISYNAGCFFDRYANSKKSALTPYHNYMKLSENVPEEAAYRKEVAARIAVLEGKR